MATLDDRDTIAAISSPPGPGLRGIVRLSGSEAIPIIQRLVTPSERQDHPANPSTPYQLTGQVQFLGREVPSSVLIWPGYRTYTGEPIAEIQTTGSEPILRRLLADCLHLGARLAEPGEFTLRAFLSGRIDLTRAEAVHAVIDAKSPVQLELALRELAGGLADAVTQLRDRLLDTVAHLEAGLDFVDEADVDPIYRQTLITEILDVRQHVNQLIDRLQLRDRAESISRVVLVGPPNAGKSRLFNALLGKEQAIVAPIAGTTRDDLNALCNCKGIPIELIDTAGIEAPRNLIEEQAQTRRMERINKADLLLVCRSPDTPEPQTQDLPAGLPQLLIWTKADLAPLPATESDSAIPTSATAGTGITELRAAIAQQLTTVEKTTQNQVGLNSVRCRDGLESSATAIDRAIQAMEIGGTDELVAVDLRLAIDELGRIVGLGLQDEILDRIFKRFCIGK